MPNPTRTPPTPAELDRAKQDVAVMWTRCCNALAKRLNELALKVLS